MNIEQALKQLENVSKNERPDPRILLESISWQHIALKEAEKDGNK